MPPDPDGSWDTATNLGNITGLSHTRSKLGTVNKADDAVDYYKFTLGKSKKVTVDLKYLVVDAGLYLEDTQGRRLKIRDSSWTSDRWFEISLEKGTYFIEASARKRITGTVRLSAPARRVHTHCSCPSTTQTRTMNIPTSLIPPERSKWALR